MPNKQISTKQPLKQSRSSVVSALKKPTVLAGIIAVVIIAGATAYAMYGGGQKISNAALTSGTQQTTVPNQSAVTTQPQPTPTQPAPAPTPAPTTATQSTEPKQTSETPESSTSTDKSSTSTDSTDSSQKSSTSTDN